MGWWYNFCDFCRQLWCRAEFRRAFSRRFSRCLILMATLGLFLYIMFCPGTWVILMLLFLVVAIIIC